MWIINEVCRLPKKQCAVLFESDLNATSVASAVLHMYKHAYVPSLSLSFLTSVGDIDVCGLFPPSIDYQISSTIRSHSCWQTGVWHLLIKICVGD